MKIGIVSKLYPPNILGGAEVVAWQTANQLKADGHSVFVITLDNKDSIETDNAVSIYKTKYLTNNYVTHAEVKNVIKRFIYRLLDLINPFLFLKFIKILRKEKPDIIHCHNIEGVSLSIWIASFFLHIPVVQHFHDYYFICRHSDLLKNNKPCKKQSPLCKVRAFIIYFLMKKCVKEVISPSLFCHSSYCSFTPGIKRIPYTIIYNGTPLTEVPVEAKNYSNTLTICFIGTLTFHKGLGVLIDCIKTVSRNNLNVHFLIGGKGSMESEVKELEKQLPIINFLGFLNTQSKIDLLQKSHLLVFPSIWQENNPVVITEAFAMGVPVLASRIGGIPEIVNDDWLVTPNDSAELYQKILFLNNNRSVLSAESSRLLSHRVNYSIQKQTSLTCDEYLKIL